MSTIGLTVQFTPWALASTADIRADRSIDSGFHVADSPNGIGKTVLYPCITSIPNSRGIPKRLSVTAACWSSSIFAGDITFSNAPISPLAMRSPVADSVTGPVMAEPSTGTRFSCPIFSSNVISESRLSTNRSISRSPPSAPGCEHPAIHNPSSTIRFNPFITSTFVIEPEQERCRPRKRFCPLR